MSGSRRSREGGFPASRRPVRAVPSSSEQGTAARQADMAAGFDVEPGAARRPDPANGDDAASAAQRGQGGRVTPPLDPRRKALELLTRREHSRQELVRKLVQRGVVEETAEAAVDDMAERGWQDDERFARSLARSRAQSGQGPLRIRAELRLHGIGDGAVEAALEACDTDWTQSAVDLLQRRHPGPARDRKEQAKRGSFLQRRGFDLDSIHAALRAAESEEG